ncbi:MAG TPA: hypothetical protein VKD23_00945 [Terriglobales bacterium]|nr:hypothetical protein [Terriglobales bacterium]
MVSIVVFHVLILLLGLGIVSRVVPLERVGYMLGYLHKAIGITAPFPEQVRTVALIWIGSAIFVVDGCLLLLVLITSLSNSG